MTDGFNSVMDFIIQIDGLKNVFRRTSVIGNERLENDAEHSWHISVMALVLYDCFGGAESGVSVDRAVKMLLLHDIVELYAGDTYCYDTAASADKRERELAAAEKIFGMLPGKLSNDFMSLWLEFDDEETPDAVFASIMDKTQPLLLNYQNHGESWIQNGIAKSQVLSRISIALERGPAMLKDYLLGIVEDAVSKGWLVDK